MPHSQGSLGKLTGLLIGVLAAATVLAALLSGYELHQTTRDARHARYEHLSDQAVQVLEQSLHLGLPLDDLQAIPSTLARLASNDPKISYFDVLSPSGTVLYSSLASRVKTAASAAMSAQAANALGGRWSATEAGQRVLGHQVSNSFNLPVAWVVIGFDERAALAESRDSAINLAWIAAGAGILACALLALALRYWRPKKVVIGDWRVMLVLGAAIALMMGCVAISAYHAAAPSVTADAQRKVDLLTRGLAARLQQAHDLGLALNQVPGVEEAIRELMAHNTEIAQTRVISNGTTLASVGMVSSAAAGGGVDDKGLVQTRLQLASDPPIELAVLTRVDPRYAQRLLFELAADLVILLIVVVFLARELLFWRMARQVEGNLNAVGSLDEAAVDARLSGLSGLRMPFLLLMLAEDFSRGFMPLFGASLPTWFVEVSRPLALGVPLAVFMACVAFSQPLFGGWVTRVGIKRVFVTGAVLSAVSHALSALAPTLELLIVCRAGAGVAWALAFIGTQAALLANPDPVTRARQLAAFVSVIMVSLVCGPSLGGFVADALGAKTALWGASGFAVVALVMVWRARAAVRKNRLPGDEPAVQSKRADLQRDNLIDDDLRVPPAGLVWALLRNPRFIGLLLLAAMPAKLMLVALCFYWVPVLAAQAGESAAMAGRMMMIYAIVMVVCAPLAARLAQHLRTKLGARTDAFMVFAGLLLSSVGGFGLWGLTGLVAVSWAMLLLGLGQSLALTPQVGVLQRVAGDSILSHGSNAVFGYYRLAERTGSALAPLVCAGLTAAIGLHSSVLVVAVSALVCAVLFAGVFARTPRTALGAVQ